MVGGPSGVTGTSEGLSVSANLSQALGGRVGTATGGGDGDYVCTSK